uniref:50S ribosomal protein L19 n=1 Tax=Lygus hesperus TaxID=30085 RepID=A0A0A9YGA0_LYGHE
MWVKCVARLQQHFYTIVILLSATLVVTVKRKNTVRRTKEVLLFCIGKDNNKRIRYFLIVCIAKRRNAIGATIIVHTIVTPTTAEDGRWGKACQKRRLINVETKCLLIRRSCGKVAWRCFAYLFVLQNEAVTGYSILLLLR